MLDVSDVESVVTEVRPCSSLACSDKLSLDDDAARAADATSSLAAVDDATDDDDDGDDDVEQRAVFPVKPAEHAASPACSDVRTSAEGRTYEQEQTDNESEHEETS